VWVFYILFFCEIIDGYLKFFIWNNIIMNSQETSWDCGSEMSFCVLSIMEDRGEQGAKNPPWLGRKVGLQLPIAKMIRRRN
jgi:hypothetical protein